MLVKVNDCTEYAVIGVIVGTDNKERKFIVAQEMRMDAATIVNCVTNRPQGRLRDLEVSHVQ